MGSSLQRLEVLAIGLIMLLAGVVVAVLMVVRPTAPAISLTATPQPIMTSADVQRSNTATSTTAPAASHEPQSTTALPRGLTLPSLLVSPTVRTSWPWLLLLSGAAGGSLVGWRMRRRRMTYTHQNVRQFLAVADSTTRADNIKVMQGLAAQGLLTAELAAAAGIDLAKPHKRRAV